MTVYVAEVNGRATFAFKAADYDTAKAQLADRSFVRDLYVFRNEDRPLWDGVSEIRLREAAASEIKIWKAGHPTARRPRVYLIPVVNPLKFADDDDD
jgi:hypothetical protein